MSQEHRQYGNHLLAVLPDLEWERVGPHLQTVDMPLGNVVYESGDRLDYVCFPTTCIVSLLYVMEDGASAEIAIVGNEGLIGIALFMGGRDHAQPGGRSKRGQRISPRRSSFERRISSRRSCPAPFAPLYPGADHPDGADRGV